MHLSRGLQVQPARQLLAAAVVGVTGLRPMFADNQSVSVQTKMANRHQID